MLNFFIAVGVIFILMGGWIIVQHFVRQFAATHPELGGFREEGQGCCGQSSCQKPVCLNRANDR
jgi:hypothetical protein